MPDRSFSDNAAEYQALILGREAASELHCTDLNIFLDSELIVRQVKGRYKIKNEQQNAEQGMSNV